MEHRGASGCPPAPGCGQGALGHLGVSHPPREGGGGLCCALVLCSHPDREAQGCSLACVGAGGCRQHPAPRAVSQGSHCRLSSKPCQAGGAIGLSALSPAQSCNSQLELVCTSLVQWYLSLLALSDLITRKKLNLTSCRCPEGTLQNSCFSQRLLILHVRAPIPGWPLISVFAVVAVGP